MHGKRMFNRRSPLWSRPLGAGHLRGVVLRPASLVVLAALGVALVGGRLRRLRRQQ